MAGRERGDFIHETAPRDFVWIPRSELQILTLTTTILSSNREDPRLQQMLSSSESYQLNVRPQTSHGMADLLNIVTKATSSFLELHKVSIDNWVFKLYYKFTTSLLILSSVLTTAK